MTNDKKQEYDDPEQSARFIELAKEVGAEDSKEPFEEAMRRIAVAKQKESALNDQAE